jgi:hypothetical protein
MRDGLYNALVKDNADIVFIDRLIMQALSAPLNLKIIWNMKILITYYYYICRGRKERLLEGTFVETVRMKLEKILDAKWNVNTSVDTSQFLEYYDVPDNIKTIVQSCRGSDIERVSQLAQMMPITPTRILKRIIQDLR